LEIGRFRNCSVPVWPDCTCHCQIVRVELNKNSRWKRNHWDRVVINGGPVIEGTSDTFDSKVRELDIENR